MWALLKIVFAVNSYTVWYVSINAQRVEKHRLVNQTRSAPFAGVGLINIYVDRQRKPRHPNLFHAQ